MKQLGFKQKKKNLKKQNKTKKDKKQLQNKTKTEKQKLGLKMSNELVDHRQNQQQTRNTKIKNKYIYYVLSKYRTLASRPHETHFATVH